MPIYDHVQKPETSASNTITVQLVDNKDIICIAAVQETSMSAQSW